MKTVGIFLLMCGILVPSVGAGEMVITAPDAFIKQKVEQICNMRKSVDCDNKSDGEIILDTISVVFEKIGYKTDFSDIGVSVNYKE